MIGRTVGSFCIAGALVLAPSSAGADDYPGTPNQDNFVGTEGDDTMHGEAGADNLEGRGGNDNLQGDDDADVLSGGDGDDSVGGGAGDDFIVGGDGVDDLKGGTENDSLHGGDGNDGLDGDSGDDHLYGNDGDDALHGDEGDDLLCGGDGDDFLWGHSGNDLACAVGDEVTVTTGAETVVDVTQNDEKLDDEVDEAFELVYELRLVSPGITALIDTVTGVLTFTATQSGEIWYSVSRDTGDPLDDLRTIGIVAVTVLAVNEPEVVDPVAEEPEEVDQQSDAADEVVDAAPSSTAVLPDTGAPENLVALAALGAAMALGGGTLVRAGARRR